MWPARPAARHVDPLDLEAERLELGAEHVADPSRPARLRVPLFWLTQFSSMASVRCLLGIDGLDHRLLGAAERRPSEACGNQGGGGGGGKAVGKL